MPLTVIVEDEGGKEVVIGVGSLLLFVEATVANGEMVFQDCKAGYM